MNYKKVFILLALIFLVGCTGLNREQPVQTNVYTGTQGMVLSFLTNYPPAVLYETDLPNNAIMIEAKNMGADDVTGGFVYITGIDGSVITIPGYSNYISQSISGLAGRAKTLSTTGDVRQLQFPITRIILPSGTDSFPVNILATACYNYKTNAAFAACVDENPFSIGTKACAPGTVTGSGSQGAPIAVTSIAEEVSSKRAVFRINIANSGGGMVVKDTTQQKCTSPSYIEQDRVTVNKVLVGNMDIRSSCGNLNKQDSTITLINKQATLVCQLQNVIGGARNVPIIVELQYAYSNTVQKQVQVKKIA